jgi:cholesterol oxidase
MDSPIPRFTLDGVPDCEKTTHPFSTEDGLGLNLTRFRRADCDDVVLLVHGLTSASTTWPPSCWTPGTPTSGRSTSG